MKIIMNEELGMKKVFVAFFKSMLFCYAFPLITFSQDTTHLTPIVHEQELLHYSPYDLQTKDIIAISPQRQIITREGNKFFLQNADVLTDKTQLISAITSPRFSSNGNYIAYSAFQNGMMVGMFAREEGYFFYVFDTRFRKTVNIPNYDSAIVRGDVSTRSEFILYQTNHHGELPKVFLAEPNGEHPRYITDGLLGDWSPNGSWFTVLKPKFYGDWESQNRKEQDSVVQQFLNKRKPNSFDLTWRVWVYNSLGDPYYELSKYDSPRFISWSPNSDKLILRSYNDDDFHILNIKDATLSGVKEIGKFGYESNKNEETHDPRWSLDGKNILYVKSYWNEDDSHCLKNETWVCNAEGSKSFKLSETDERTTEYPLWSKDGTILLIRERLNLSDQVELYVVEQTITNLDELLK